MGEDSSAMLTQAVRNQSSSEILIVGQQILNFAVQIIHGKPCLPRASPCQVPSLESSHIKSPSRSGRVGWRYQSSTRRRRCWGGARGAFVNPSAEGGRISQLRWAPWIVVSTRSGGLGRSLPRLTVFFLAGLLGIVTTYCSNTWVQDELNMSQILYQTISRGISSVMFVHHLCLYRNAPQASPGISKEPGENGVSSGAKIIPIPFSNKFEGGVMGSDGCIYCIPLRLSSTAVSSWPSRPQSPMELWFVPSLSRSWQKHANIAHHYTQTPRFARQPRIAQIPGNFVRHQTTEGILCSIMLLGC